MKIRHENRTYFVQFWKKKGKKTGGARPLDRTFVIRIQIGGKPIRNNPDEINLRIYISVYEYEVHVYVYMLGSGMIHRPSIKGTKLLFQVMKSSSSQ